MWPQSTWPTPKSARVLYIATNNNYYSIIIECNLRISIIDVFWYVLLFHCCYDRHCQVDISHYSLITSPKSLRTSLSVIRNGVILMNCSLKNSRHFTTPPLIFLQSDFWVTSAKIPLWTYATEQEIKQDSKPCVTSMTIILFEEILPQTSSFFKQIFL